MEPIETLEVNQVREHPTVFWTTLNGKFIVVRLGAGPKGIEIFAANDEKGARMDAEQNLRTGE